MKLYFNDRMIDQIVYFYIDLIIYQLRLFSVLYMSYIWHLENDAMILLQGTYDKKCT